MNHYLTASRDISPDEDDYEMEHWCEIHRTWERHNAKQNWLTRIFNRNKR